MLFPIVNFIATTKNASAATIIDTGNTGKIDVAVEADASGSAHAIDIAAKTTDKAKPEKTSNRDFIIPNQHFSGLLLWMSRHLRTFKNLHLEDF
ncbi:MAG TPA: hypothetical protein VLH35_03695 [Candidatus Acidoferrales bacterium]|nr:hypothetical protein [Candidatus Acidoferrales bacterium]